VERKASMAGGRARDQRREGRRRRTLPPSRTRREVTRVRCNDVCLPKAAFSSLREEEEGEMEGREEKEAKEEKEEEEKKEEEKDRVVCKK